jgi:DNA-binding NtrC family response regulator
VRELQNVIEHVAVLVEPEQVIEPGDIPIYDDAEAVPERTAAPQLDGPFHDVKDRVIAQFERDYLTRLVARAAGNMSKAARQANIDRTTLYRLMEKHGLQRDDRGE